MYLLGTQVLPTVIIKPVATSTLQVRHSTGLLNDLFRIHQARVMHRDSMMGICGMRLLCYAQLKEHMLKVFRTHAVTWKKHLLPALKDAGPKL